MTTPQPLRKRSLNPNRGLPVIPTACLLVFALALRLHHLDYESLWVDELLQVSFYSHPFDQIARYAAHQQQPPLDYWIGFGVNSLSSSDFAVRIPSVFFGVGVVFLITLLVRSMCTLPVAFGAGILAALFPFSIHFSQEARPYAIATFLFLALLWAVARLLGTSEGAREKTLTLFLISVAFLHSRGFEPLVITALLMFILSLRLAYSILRHGVARTAPQQAALYSVTTLGLALALYLPMFKTLLDCGEPYLSKTSGFPSLPALLAGIEGFNLRPILLSFAFQTEPLTYSLLALLFLSPILAWRRGLWLTHEAYALAALLLPGISLLHLFVFQTYTDANFKPQYAFYLLPLTLILCGAAFQGLWDTAASLNRARILRAVLLVLAAYMVLGTVNSMWDYKTSRKKEDWKGLCRHLAEAYGSGQILLFDTLVPYGGWEGNFYGFRRYYKGNSQRLVVAQVPSSCSKMVRMDKEPVLILYHRADLCLTLRSLYCRFLPQERRSDYISKDALALDPLLSVSAFAGFHVITLKQRTFNTGVDAYTLLSRTISRLPGGQSIIDLYLALAGLARVLGLPEWEKHLISAETIATSEQRLKMSGVTRMIRDMPAPKGVSVLERE
jgi:4-amino-4-deoxy-L-arabinose transferase-like glycosyltransferase